jgi:hypothetical protein
MSTAHTLIEVLGCLFLGAVGAFLGVCLTELRPVRRFLMSARIAVTGFGGQAEMTHEKSVSVGGLTVILGDSLETFERAGVPRARIVRVVALQGTPVLSSPAETRALATALVSFADEQDSRRPAAA